MSCEVEGGWLSLIIYLDACCLNRPFDDQSQDRIRLETEAVLSILNRCLLGEWQLIGSEALDYEISKMPDDDRKQKSIDPSWSSPFEDIH